MRKLLLLFSSFDVCFIVFFIFEWCEYCSLTTVVNYGKENSYNRQRYSGKCRNLKPLQHDFVCFVLWLSITYMISHTDSKQYNNTDLLPSPSSHFPPLHPSTPFGDTGSTQGPNPSTASHQKNKNWKMEYTTKLFPNYIKTQQLILSYLGVLS